MIIANMVGTALIARSIDHSFKQFTIGKDWRDALMEMAEVSIYQQSILYEAALPESEYVIFKNLEKVTDVYRSL